MSDIDPTKPETGFPTTESVRINFAAAKAEIEALNFTVTTLTNRINQLEETVSNMLNP